MPLIKIVIPGHWMDEKTQKKYWDYFPTYESRKAFLARKEERVRKKRAKITKKFLATRQATKEKKERENDRDQT